jgi:hypothetical protein
MRVEDLMEFCAQVHNQLHLGNVGEAHELLHKALAGERIDMVTIAPFLQRLDFDAAFRTACRKNGAVACYVHLIREDGKTRILTGGDADLCAWLDETLRRAL